MSPLLGRMHALTIFLGAFLLFEIQPLLSKWILPWFGGGPAVWTTCLLFFQAALFAGYAYAYLSRRFLPVRVGPLVHLALDAFSGESIPTHLLTVEAMEIYLRHLAPDGVIAAHVSNRSLDLAPVVRGAARRFGLSAIEIDLLHPDGLISAPSNWILCTRDETAIRELAPYATKHEDARETVWTDDRSDLFSVLRR